ncbi:MAG: hypothetical protein WDZ94_02730 [Patescibacteria group bacterium]
MPLSPDRNSATPAEAVSDLSQVDEITPTDEASSGLTPAQIMAEVRARAISSAMYSEFKLPKSE